MSLKDMEVPDKGDDGVRRLGEPLGIFTENFIKIGHQEPCQKHFFGKNYLMGGSFGAPGPPQLTFVGSKRCQILFILSM